MWLNLYILKFLRLSFGALFGLIILPQFVFGAVVLVENTDDDGAGSFRSALSIANDAEEDVDIIFEIPENDPRRSESGQYQISVLSPLPPLQSDNTIRVNGKGSIILDGNRSKANFPGVTITSSNHEVTGLTIRNFGDGGILVHGSDERNVETVKIYNNKILDNGIYDENGNSGDGVRLAVNVRGSLIFDNLIARNRGNGILLESLTSAVWSNRIYGNYIASNQKNGIRLEGSRNIVGIDINNEPNPNIIGLNNLHGILLNGDFAHGNKLAYNLIGLGPDKKAQGNRLDGIHLKSGAKNNEIGPSMKIFYNGGGVILKGRKTVGNTIEENEIFGNQSEGILMENIDATPSSKILNNRIDQNETQGIHLIGASPKVWENIITSNAEYGLKIGVFDDGNPNIFEDQKLQYSIPEVESNHFHRNKFGGIYSLDTTFKPWDKIEQVNKFQKNFGPDVLAQWKYVFSFTPQNNNFGAISTEITNCTPEKKSCLGREIRELDNLYYVGPEKNFNPKDHHTFFTVTHFVVLNGFRENFSPHNVILTGDEEKSFLLRDADRANMLIYPDTPLQASVIGSSKDKTISGPEQQVHIGVFGYTPQSLPWIWVILMSIVIFFLYHFWLAGHKIHGKQSVFDVGITDDIEEVKKPSKKTSRKK